MSFPYYFKKGSYAKTNQPINQSWMNKNYNDAIRSVLDYTPDLKIPSDTFYNHIRQFSNNDSITRPHEFAWEITNNCNLKCTHCFVKDAPPCNDVLPKTLCFSIIDQLRSIGIYKIIFSGGEPFLRNDFLEIVEYAKKFNMAVVIHTNGLLLNNQILAILSQILHPKIDLLQISLDGDSNETHDKIRGNGTFKTTLDNINKVIENKITLRINFTPTSINLNSLPDTFLLCSKLNIKYFTVSDFIELRDTPHLIPDSKLLIKALAEVIKKSFKSNTTFDYLLDANCIIQKRIDIPSTDESLYNKQIKTHKLIRCSNSFNSMAMRSDGRIFLCIPSSYCDTDKFCIGNAKTTKIIDIWENRRNNILYIGRKADLMKCYTNNCNFFEYCKGGCIAKSFYYSHDIYAPDPRCQRIQ